MGKFKQAITHSGKPHIDECMGYAILEYVFGDIPIVRKDEFTQKEVFDPNIVIFDVGKIFDRKINCFDHHQDHSLPSACVLLWREFAPETTEEERLIKRIVEKQCLRFISDHDKGDTSTVEKSLSLSIAFHFLTFECTDHNQAFEKGVDICRSILRGLVAKIHKERIGLNSRWGKEVKRYGPDGSIASLNKPIDYLPKDWALLAKKEGVIFVLAEDLRTKQTNMYAVNGKVIPKDLKRQSFWEGGTKASYKRVADAINHALELVLKK